MNGIEAKSNTVHLTTILQWTVILRGCDFFGSFFELHSNHRFFNRGVGLRCGHGNDGKSSAHRGFTAGVVRTPFDPGIGSEGRKRERKPSAGAVAAAATQAIGDGTAMRRRSGGRRSPGADGGSGGGAIGCIGVWQGDQSTRGSGGTRRHGSGFVGCFVAVRLHTRDRLGARVGAAVRGEYPVPLVVRGSQREPSFVIGLSHRSWRSLG